MKAKLERLSQEEIDKANKEMDKEAQKLLQERSFPMFLT